MFFEKVVLFVYAVAVTTAQLDVVRRKFPPHNSHIRMNVKRRPRSKSPTSSSSSLDDGSSGWKKVSSKICRKTRSGSSSSTTNKCCQGLDSGTCDLRVHEIMYAYMHNAANTMEDGVTEFPTHEWSLEKALEGGFRALELGVGRCNEQVVFYHDQCERGFRDAKKTLQGIGNFLEQHPTEIVLLMLQMPKAHVVSLAQFDSLLQDVPSVSSRLYAHPEGTLWPTLGELVNADERAILFYWNQASCRDQACPNGAWHYWKDYGEESNWDMQALQDFEDVSSCAPRRGRTVTNLDFYRVNAFIQGTPSREAAKTLNDYDYVAQRVDTCAANQAHIVSMYAVDFWTEGHVVQYVQDVNRARAEEAAAAAAHRRNE